MVLRIHISDYVSRDQYISSLAWYHNGTELISGDGVTITNNGTSLTISNMAESDAGKYEVRINSLGSDPVFCDRNLLPLLENFALYAPVTFLLQESNLPTYNPEDIILDYDLKAYQSSAQQSLVINNTIMVDAAAALGVTLSVIEHLYKDGVHISDRSTYNSTISFDSIMAQHSLRIPYNNTDDIAGYYGHLAFAYNAINSTTCPDYYAYVRGNSYVIPIFTLYWNTRSYGKLIIVNIVIDIPSILRI